ncbi:TetR/AcrR family transcriptional regulator [Protaetiibacter sp. SSC-01]|uniref:TetR/AcrR family transcriptional regulator n=1 Tax=Protaetiibacter sp. SSC-01 TaxID=2759943 RepID=UPI001656AD61|nr:TetR/AcrR family transcriptional regulator [Protaetiibacter sp. SSC-01]QNO38580.1 TetR/AcrR family transcriptional regulator [Protaetiibacter sp. SSC-01]
MSSPMTEQGATRMRSDERRALVLEAATRVFGERGYHGATTDAVAREAGVSQPYVVRMFGGKEAMFLAVLDRAIDRILGAFEADIVALEAEGRASDEDAVSACLGRSYVDLLGDRGLLLSLMQAFMLGSEPVVGRHAREGFRRVYAYLRERVGLDPDAAQDFLSRGMLLNTVVGLRMVDDYESDANVHELLDELLPTKIDVLLALRGDAT